MAEKVGFENGDGILTTGGSNGNMIGLLMARQRYDPSSLQNGSDGRQLVVFCSEETHYSISMAANVLGLGHKNVIKVKVDADGRIDPSELAVKVKEAKEQGKHPFCVVGTAGSVVRGAYDPLRELAAICKEHKMWFHIDAAWGGGCLLSDNHRYLMDGAHLADSLCWDAHKMMGVPLICSAFITTDLALLKEVCSHT